MRFRAPDLQVDFWRHSVGASLPKRVVTSCATRRERRRTLANLTDRGEVARSGFHEEVPGYDRVASDILAEEELARDRRSQRIGMDAPLLVKLESVRFRQHFLLRVGKDRRWNMHHSAVSKC